MNRFSSMANVGGAENFWVEPGGVASSVDPPPPPDPSVDYELSSMALLSFSAKTRDLFRQKMMRKRRSSKSMHVGPPVQDELKLQRPTKLPLLTAVHEKKANNHFKKAGTRKLSGNAKSGGIGKQQQHTSHISEEMMTRYSVQPIDRNVFQVMDLKTDIKSKVTIGPQTCSCSSQEFPCSHLIFVMTKALGVSERDPKIWMTELDPHQVDSLTSWLASDNVPVVAGSVQNHPKSGSPRVCNWLEDLEVGGDCEAIPLPHSEPIPQQFWTVACGWIPIVGRDIVACLFSRDWELREASIRRLAREVANAMTTSTDDLLASGSLQEAMLADKLDRIWRCSAEMMAKAAEDKVFKVYQAALKGIRTLLAFAHFSKDANYIKAALRPILHTILLKCADGQKRMAELSLEAVSEFCQEPSQAFIVGNCGYTQRQPTVTINGLDFIISLIGEDKDSSWQFAMGRLVALDQILSAKMGLEGLATVIEFTFRHLADGHSRVAKMALKVFTSALKQLIVLDPHAFTRLWEENLSSGLDLALQLALKKRLRPALLSLPSPMAETVLRALQGHNNHLGEGQSPSSGCSLIVAFSPPSLPPPLIRSTSNSPSRPTTAITTPTTTTNQRQQQQQMLKKAKRPTPYGKYRPGKKMVVEEMHFDVHLRQEQQRPLPFIPGLSSHGSWHSRLINNDGSKRCYSEGKHWSKSFMLGSGAFSTCYQARDVLTGTLMAVKQIQLNLDDDAKVKLEPLLSQEIDLMSSLDHPNLVRLFGVVQEDCHQLNIFVEWMAGGSVARLLDKHGAFNEPVIVNYTGQILQGLDYLHSAGILHRDLKGANLFVDSSGLQLRIGDFGAAACLRNGMTYPGEFRGQLQGTLAFMAPEVLRGESYGRSCDIWSLGCCIVEMATARAPWNAADISNYYCLMYKIACSPTPPAIPVHLSVGLQNLASKCLQLVPEERPHAKDLLSHPLFLFD